MYEVFYIVYKAFVRSPVSDSPPVVSLDVAAFVLNADMFTRRDFLWVPGSGPYLFSGI